MNRRFGNIHEEIYSLMWNDVQRKKEQYPQKRDINVEKELKKCIKFCEMSGNEHQISFFNRIK